MSEMADVCWERMNRRVEVDQGSQPTKCLLREPRNIFYNHRIDEHMEGVMSERSRKIPKYNRHGRTIRHDEPIGYEQVRISDVIAYFVSELIIDHRFLTQTRYVPFLHNIDCWIISKTCMEAAVALHWIVRDSAKGVKPQ